MKNEDSKHLILALEPEAASIYCQSLQMEKFFGHHNIKDKENPLFCVGVKHLIVDAGGKYTVVIPCNKGISFLLFSSA